MSGWGSKRRAAELLCAAAAAAFLALPARAQSAPPPTDPAELDPNAPLDPLPELGVDWPDLGVREGPPQAPDPDRRVDRRLAEPSGAVLYTVSIRGFDGVDNADELLAVFHQQSTLDANRKEPANAAQISRRASSDAELLAELLRSKGYYDAIVQPSTHSYGTGLEVVLTAAPGAQYRFASVVLPGLEAAGPEAARFAEEFGVKPGDPVIASEVIAGGLALTRALGEQGFAEAKLGDQDIEIDHATHLASLRLPVNPGPIARFGTIRVSGRPPFSARHVATIARFKTGDPFQRSKLDDLRRALIATTLVASADLQIVPTNNGRTVDVDVRLEPAPSHTIAGEAGYGTGQGARLEASWTDRNFLNPEGALTLRGVLGTNEQLAGVQFRRSNFLRRDQVLNLLTSVSHQNFEAYEARTALLAGYIERQSNFIWQKRWTWVYGGEILGTDERGAFSPARVKSTRKFLIAAAPVTLGYDGSDSLLDPTRGVRLTGRVSPEVSSHGGHRTYARTQFDASAYWRLGSRAVAAGRVRVGTIFGASVYDIAPSRRLYSGGGGSVRGYGYQRLGPKDIEGDPIGGRGLAEFAFEARVRLKQFGGNFGIVPFFDGGSLTTKARPDFTNWRLAAGVGVRYYSSFGPIRIDLGVPLNREKGDGPVAVTVSLGQAF